MDWETEGKALCPLSLFLTIDPGWTEGQWARDQCIRADIAAEMESWGQDWEDAGNRRGLLGAQGRVREPRKSSLGLQVPCNMTFFEVC